jgi:membrane associated rhomboid family serine protease
MLFPNMELMFLFFPVPIKAKYLVGAYLIYEIWGAHANNPNDHVAHFAHLGGALFGFILVKIWSRNRTHLY